MLRLLEHYASPQGEGPRVGIMSQFVRFAGCNLKCPSWPCDTPQAIDPKIFSREQKHVRYDDLIKSIMYMRARTGANNVVFTGGEPLLQNHEDLASVADGAKMANMTVEIFTNGTRPINAFFTELCSFVMDWKLTGSGEDPFNAERLENVRRIDSPKNAVKFVISRMNDLGLAYNLYKEYLERTSLEVYVGAAWGQFSNEVIVEYVKNHQLPWRLNVQVHNYLFGAHRRYT